ncbi:fatty acid elongase ELO1 [Sugiyamaella lignohabitans]|uniref:Elongation of fatty acids protein n=1 Tax=Sugiyamaella lignohabitans TaxID=796027 RepID=A0A167CF52_9ASCO|nr:fatty acid elongase ELO1 [Sugiyamaella lignohabitans]ANB11609.1 fatty acid elongase ELO1 [Sugiyamaella lignohabitans]
MGNTTFQGSSYISKPPTHIFTLPLGLDLPPGPPAHTFLASYFESFLDIKVPITIAAVYAISVHLANHVRKTNKTPLSICNTKLFKGFVLAHNIGLCIYSAWTCAGMTAAIYRTVFELTKVGMSASTSGEQVADFLSGQAGLLGTSKRGSFWRSLCDLNSGIWEQGLNYYGFFFYLSKFYEVFDTVIILAKGKQSSLLQTYHHAGAMMSMWAGIRFASPPIWIFVVFNSLIHTLMYFYYTLSALKVKVPKALKRALTTAQISQFVLGGSFAVLHLFVYYFNPSTGNYCACLKDAGQGFALLFNVVYLAPLTYLFVNFWIDQYVRSFRKGAGSLKTAAPSSSQSKKTK